MYECIELAQDEVFLGNTYDGIPDYLRELNTIRLGEQAYDIRGVKLPHDYRPMIINRTEVPAYEKIMADILSAIRSGKWKPVISRQKEGDSGK